MILILEANWRQFTVHTSLLISCDIFKKKCDIDIFTIFWKWHDNCVTIYRQTIFWGLAWASTYRQPLKSGRVGSFLEASLISAEWQSEMRKLRWNVRRDIWSKEDISLSFNSHFQNMHLWARFDNIYWLGISSMRSWSQFWINPLYPLLSRFSICSPELLLLIKLKQDFIHICYTITMYWIHLSSHSSRRIRIQAEISINNE